LPTTTSSSVQKELNSRIDRDREEEDAPWSGEHCPNQGIRPGGDQSKQPINAVGDKNTPTDLTTLQATLEAKKAQCNDQLERDLIQDYLEDLLCLNRQQTLTTTQEIKTEHVRNNTGNADKQIPQIQKEELTSINDKLCKAQGIEEIPWRQSDTAQVPLPLEVPETYKSAARMLGLFKPTTSKVAEPMELPKKGIEAPIKGTHNTTAMLERQPKPLPGLEYLEDLEDESPIADTERMIVENHDVKQGQEAQRMLETVQAVQRGVKHDLLDPHAQENKHLDQKEGHGLERMVVADHGPKKGMAPRLKTQFNPLFFPFATCLPNTSMPRDYDHQAKHNVTPKAHSQTSPMGREANDNQNKLELDHPKGSTINTMSTDPIQSESTSPRPDQWWLEELDNDMTDPEDLWPDTEGTDTWNDDPDTEELDWTNNASDATPGGLIGELQWITEQTNAIELEQEEDPFPLMLHNLDLKSTPEEELSPQTSNQVPDWKETLSLQNNQHDQDTQGQRNPKSKSQGSTSDDKKETTNPSTHLIQQNPTHPTSDDKEGTTTVEPTSLNTKTPLLNKEVPAIDNITRGRNPRRSQEPISHPDMTQPWMTRQPDTKAEQYNANQPERENTMEPMLQTSAHYPKTSKQNNRSSGNQSFGTLSASPIQERADRAKTSLSAMTHGTDNDRSSTPPSNDRESKKHATPPKIGEAGTDQSRMMSGPDQKRTALTILGIIITAMLTIAQGNRAQHEAINQAVGKTVTSQKPRRRTTRDAECPRCKDRIQEELQYKSPLRNATSSPSNPPVLLPTPTTPNNTPITSPCPPPLMTPPLLRRSEDSGSKERSTTTPGKAMTSSTHGEVTTTAVTPGIVAR